jgi:hypothetical protein
MKIFKVAVLVVAFALLGSTFTVDAKVKKRRRTIKKEKIMQKPKKAVECNQTVKNEQCALDMVEYMFQGMRMSPLAQVRVERKDDKVVLVIKGTTTDEREIVIDDGEQLLKDALAIIEEEKMLDYAVSYAPATKERILDGYRWEFKAKLADGRSVSSRGSNAGPGGEGLNKIRKLLHDRAQKELKMDNE